ncbi:Rrf2 family transcriptional regulator [Fontibacillus sp. BL9]|uniref:Rrf2 family transcriptional regulator n=1 Tax=Fontibacillus sp. BL9 TaxID=3389971 RepID=UPI00397AB36E
MNSDFNIATHCLLFLYTREEKMANSEQIACSVSTHPARVRKVLSLLRKQGYVATKEGVGGGYHLNVQMDEVTLGDLYRLFARGSLHRGWCSGSEQSPCLVSSNIHSVMELIFNGGEERLESYFSEITLSDVHRLLRKRDTEDGRTDGGGAGNECIER